MSPAPARTVDDLIGTLGADLRPVRRLGPPWRRALVWLGLVAVIGVGLASVANLPAVAMRLRGAPDMGLATAGAILTTVLAALAAFALSVPDARGRWALLPLPGLVLWLAGTGMGCLRSWDLPGMHPASMHETTDCLSFIVGLSLPLSVAMILMVRRAYALRPNLTAMMGGLAAAGAAASLLTLFHPYDAGATDLAVHAFAVTLVVVANRLVGGRLLSAATTSA